MAQRQVDPTEASPVPSVLPSPGMDVLDVKASKRRQECLQNQRRYRLRKKKKFEAKAEQLETLQCEIRRLQDHAHMLKAKLLMRFIEAGMQRSNTISSYWELFRFGLADPGGKHHLQQIEFIQTRMHDDMYVNGNQGSHLLLDQWRAAQSMIRHFDAPNLRLQVFGAEQEFIVSSGTVYMQLTRETIALIFPGLVAREDLVQLILRRPVPCPLRVSWHFRGGQVESMDINFNLIEGMRQCVAEHMNAAAFYGALEAATAEAHLTTNGLLDQEIIDIVDESSRKSSPARCSP
ncbi:hypothetical protein ACHHYP_01242 [Achlya hypogyna]|uniref:BZIP domain-containing protein n=1 Tax=Achlya hypogyna TaxID=1202772 RepID=A0A1V9Z930_ACHHY|nr:hypothetical protein ACHHYP_01242 [Achlya hypogyna]